MAKFPFKRPRIISKKFPELDSSIDGVTKSLNDLVFSYHEQVQNALTKKHWLMAFSSIALLLVLGSFISMKGKAESSIFYPETCLGGWINPQNAQGEQQTTSNGDESQFTKDNSAVLPKNTNAEMYCGNFKGKFDASTRPTKILVSLALTKGGDLSIEDTFESGLVAATSTEIPDVASSPASTTLQLASSTSESTEASTTTSEDASTTTSVGKAIATPGAPKDDGPSVIDGVVKSVQDTVHDIFGGSDEKVPQTDTVVVPPPTPAESTPAPTPSTESQPAPTSDSPTSLLPSVTHLLALLFDTVLAQEEPAAVPATDIQITPQPTEPIPATPVEPQPLEVAPTESIATTTQTESEVVVDPVIVAPVDATVLGVTTTTEQTTSTTTDVALITSTSTSSTTDMMFASSTDVSATTTEPVSDENQFQNNFLEVLYTFDGVTWTSLGELNEISMKYRTFEIPVTASTSWSDLKQLQIKVQAKKREKDTPTVYLDGIKVEVLYESDMQHMHPDFARDTILKDEIVDGIRIVTIINNDTKEKEIWYMILELDVTASSTLSISTSTLEIASSTEVSSTSAVLNSSSTDTSLIVDASSTASTTLEIIKTPVVDLLKNKWKKYTGKDITIGTAQLVVEIKQQEESEKIEELDILPDFATDTIKRMKGVSSHQVLVQIERGTEENPRDELWLYDVDKNSQEKIGKSTSTVTSIAANSPIGVKGGYLFWLSIDKDKVYAYGLENKDLLEQKIPEYNADKGERAHVIFPEIPWKVIMNDDNFFFYSDVTGEVFSDDNGSITETFRQTLGLDSILNKDEISNLNLRVDNPVEENNQN